MKVVLNQLLFYQPAAKASMPSVRMHKRKWLLFMLPFQLVGVIISLAFNFNGLTNPCVDNMYYYFYSTANSESKDSFLVFLDREFDVSLPKVDR